MHVTSYKGFLQVGMIIYSFYEDARMMFFVQFGLLPFSPDFDDQCISTNKFQQTGV